MPPRRRITMSDLPGAPSWAAPLVDFVNDLSDDSSSPRLGLSDLRCQVYNGIFTHGVAQRVTTQLPRVGGAVCLGAYERVIDAIAITGASGSDANLTVWFKDPTTVNCRASVVLFPDGVAGSRLADAYGVAVPWTAPALINGFANVGVPFMNVGFTKDASGFVHLRGTAVNGAGTAAGNPLFQLPAGYRPSSRVIFTTSTSPTVFTRVDVDANGFVFNLNATAAGTYLALDGMTFDTR